MTPAACVAAAIDLLNAIIAGASAEKTLTTWARNSRFAGSGDRAAIRDHVFDALRCRRSFGWLGGADTGRGLMIGAMRAQGIDPATVFTGAGYGAEKLSDTEAVPRDLSSAPVAVQGDVPDWLYTLFEASLGADTVKILDLMRSRAPVYLRVNQAVVTPVQAAEALRDAGIETAAHHLSVGALCALTNPRKIKTSQAFLDGWIELQDAASQAVVDAITICKGARVLDYCAGGGGKALSLAARSGAQVFAHDADPARMRDIPARAARAGVKIDILDTGQLTGAKPFDLVLCDAPCSGSGAWRRAPEAKWRLTLESLAALNEVQAEILDRAAALVAPNGTLAYVTCSLLSQENQRQSASFLIRNPGWELVSDRQLTPLDGGDGFYLAQFRRLTTLP